MPELPEVEVTRRMLEPMLLGRTVAVVRATAPSYFFLTSPAVLRRRLPGRRVDGLDRVGKYLLARLDDGTRLLLHLGMTGEIFREGAAIADRHTHLRLRFTDGGPDVLFRDERKFGKVQLLAPGEISRRLARLGVDALALRPTSLHTAARGRRVAIKSLLLNQSVLAGVGNIYADEALFLVGVRPTRQARRVTREESRRLVLALKRVLRRSIAAGGTTISDYIRPDGREGTYQEERRVYGRTGEPCPVCGTRIRRLVLGQRSAHFCPRCQK
ncbi:MAG TPA: bifunctional DNA-formamidopyrimidine glycosylase/DNA-(apurinic or apyrimidinic site) lyase [Vicinamibacteria bacterium]